MDGYDAQPAKDRVAVGLTPEEDGPGGLARVFDQFARRPDGVRDSPVELTVVPAVELGLVAT